MTNAPVTFPSHQRKACVQVPIEDDSIVEHTEDFGVILTKPPELHDMIRLAQTYTVVLIISDDGEHNGHTLRC